MSARMASTMTVGLAMVTVAACSGGQREAESPAPGAGYVESVEAWRAKHEADYRQDWVSIAGLHFLEPGTFRVGSAATNDIVLAAAVPSTIGRVIVADGRIRYEPEPGVPVLQKGQPVTGSIVLKEPGSPPADELTIDDVRLVIHESGDRLSLRVRDPKGKLAQGFVGFAWFPIDPNYRVVGRFIADQTPKKMAVPNTFGDNDAYATEGVIEFALHGQTVRLRPFTTRPKRFYIVFRDASSGVETYETARFLYADLRDDGTTVLDFNEAYNPPCSFNPYTTCPIPLKENKLPVKVLAGEKAYPVHVPLPAPAS
ncbi:MAG TPA: DUF1684 domain-containing protein [Vicinamibacterales bacterium]|nr:DUF1684 domain-containing protein [Vicinamibacterales bacterium]